MLIPGIDGNLYEFKIDTDHENNEFQLRMYGALWPKENPYLKKEKDMNNAFDARERDKLLNELNTQNAHVGAMGHELAELRNEFDQMEQDLADAEERENVKDALINEQRKKIEELNITIKNMTSQVEKQAETISNKRDEIKALKNKVAFLNGMCSGTEFVTKENAQLKEEIKLRDTVIIELRKNINVLVHKIRKYEVAGYIINACLDAASKKETPYGD